MFKLNFFQAPLTFWNRDSTRNTSTNEGNNKNNNNNNNATAGHLDRSKVISMNHSEEGDFVEVDIKKLSYAEVAALSRTAGLDGNKIRQTSTNNNNNNTVDDEVVDEHDLEREVTDYQMSNVLSQNTLRKKTDILDNAAIGGGTDIGNTLVDSFQDEVIYNDKSNRRSKKSKFLKKGK